MLYGAAALMGIRSPIVVAHTMNNCYPWLPDVVTAVQLSGGIYLPPAFHAAGVGASAADVCYAQSRLQELEAVVTSRAGLTEGVAAAGPAPGGG